MLGAVRAPAELLARPYLSPVYDEPEFIVRNLYRLYGGWWDGNPAHLKPARDVDLARELSALAGGAAKLAARADELAAAGDLALAAHLIELAATALPSDRAIRSTRSKIYAERAARERSLMAKGVFTAANRLDPDHSRTDAGLLLGRPRCDRRHGDLLDELRRLRPLRARTAGRAIARELRHSRPCPRATRSTASR